MSNVIDEKLLEFAAPRQAELIRSANELGSVYKAAKALGMSKGNAYEAIRAVKRRAAVQGYSPEHGIVSTIAPGYVGKGHSTLERVDKYDPETGRTTILQWTKTKADEEARFAMIEQAFMSAAETLPRMPPAPKPKDSLKHLANLYTITDYHLGMHAWKDEGGADWDLGIAERTLYAAFEHMIRNAPPAAKAIINIQGDFLHTDGLSPVTPMHGHVLDAAGRYAQMVHAAIRVLRRVCDLALSRHTEVEVVFAEGNHDLAGSMWLRLMFAALYERDKRLRVNDSELPYYAIQHGKVMIAIHHGHMSKNGSLPLLFAAQFPAIWGATTKRYAHCGHRHHAEEKEHAGMSVVQHQTLAARDAYAARGGWFGERAATCVTYHAEFGQVARTFVTPEMLAA